MPSITFLPERITKVVPKGTTILEAARAAQMEIITDCEFGWCGTDAFTIVSGIENLTPPEKDERENILMNHFPPNVRMACVAGILGDIVVEPFN